MAITLTTDPASGSPATNPVVVSDCLEWCLQPDTADVFATPGTFATLEVNFPTTISSIPADGTQITIWGHIFEIDSAIVPSTAQAFRMYSSGNITGASFRQMLNANIFFAQNTVVDDDGFSLANTVVTWNTCGEQGNFSGANMDLQALIDAGATVTITNGVTPVITDGYTMQVRLLRTDATTNVFFPVSEFEGLQPLGNCDEISETCINYMKDAARLLFTPMPDLSTTSEIDPEEDTLTGRFLIQYGWNYKDANCQPISGSFYPSDEVFIVNAAFGHQDAEGIMPYWALHPDFDAGGRAEKQWFLTNQPKKHKISESSFAWLWFLNAFTGTVQGLAPFTPDHFDLEFEITHTGGGVGHSVEYAQIAWYQVWNFNISPALVASFISIDVEDLISYTVQLKAFDAGETDFAIVSEQLSFGVEHDCDESRDIYFVTPQGGIGTLSCEITESEIVQEGTEICLDTPCATSRTEAAKYSGRQLGNLRSFDRVTLKSRQNYGEDWREYFRSFKASPDRYLQVKEKKTVGADTWIAKRFNPDPGGIKIFQTAEYIDLVATGTLADIPVQSPKNVA